MENIFDVTEILGGQEPSVKCYRELSTPLNLLCRCPCLWWRVQHRHQFVYNIVGVHGNGQARKAARGGVIGRRYSPPLGGNVPLPSPHQLGDLGERSKLPQWDPERSPGKLAI